MARYINPFTDFGFKKLFGSQKAKPCLINMLNSILELKDPIKDLRYENVEKFGISPDDRNAIFDLYCTTESGEHIIVEMQNSRQRYFKDRSVYYSTFPIAESAKSGEWDFRLPPVYFLGFLNFRMQGYENDPDFKHMAMLLDLKTKEPFYDKLKFVYLEMPKFVKGEDELADNADKWLYVIKNMNELENLPSNLKEETFKEFFRIAEISALKKDERKAYELSLKHMRDYNNTVNFAREEGMEKGIEEGMAKGMAKGLAKGKEIGRAEGRKEGIAEGRKEGIAEGRKEGQLELIRKMKSMGADAATIANLTGMSIDEINHL